MTIRLGNPSIVTDKLLVAYDAKSPLNYILNEVEVLVVAGGGGGSGDFGNGGGMGGGGGGGVIYSSSYKVTPASGITVTVGNGGNGGTGSTQAARSNAMRGNQGQNSVFGTLIAIGGGGGSGDGASDSTTYGGSGGGGGYTGTTLGGRGEPGQGNPGGNHSNRGLAIYADPFSNNYAGGGGGGAGQRGQRGHTTEPPTSSAYSVSYQKGGKGGDGILLNISGRPRYYSGGGGGGTYSSGLGGDGGSGGGGNGGRAIPSSTGESGTPGISGTGGGGGAGGGPGASSNIGGNGGAGGKGVVIVRYPGPQKASGGDTISTIGGYTIHTFNNSGTFTPFSTNLVNGGNIFGLEDLSGNGHALTYKGSPAYSTDGGGSIEFSFASDDGLYTPSKSNLLKFERGNFTIEFWFKMVTDGDTTNVYYTFANIGNNTSYGSSQLYWNVWRSGYPSGALSAGLLYNRINNAAALGYNYVTNEKVSGIGWVYLVHKEDNGTTSWEMRGGTTHTESVSTPSYPVGTAGASYIALGDLIGDGGRSFGGNISEVRIYNKVLSDAEIDQNYNATKGRYGY